MDIFKKMHQLKNLTATEKALIEYIEKDPLNFIQMKPKEIASQAYISVASIYRLISKLELDGFNDLKVAVNLSLQQKRENIENIDYPILPTDSHYEVMLRLKKVYENTIQDTLDLIDPETLVCISQLMNQSAAIDVYTSSANLYFALNFQFQMQEINVPIQVYEDEYRQGLCAANSDPSHLALVISRFVDMLSDPIVGYISDRFDSRWGRRIPFIAVGTVPLALSTIAFLCRCAVIEVSE